LDQRKVEQLGTSLMMTHLSHNMNMIGSGLRALYGKSLREPFKMFACLIAAGMISVSLLMLSLVIIPAGGYLIKTLSRRMKKSMQTELGWMANVYQTLMETLSWMKTVRIFNRESTERLRFKQNAGVLYRMSMRISLYDSLLRPISEVLGIVAIALSILAGTYLVLNQTTQLFGWQILERPMKPSMLILFYMMLAGASDPARKMSEIINILVRGDTACQNLSLAYDIRQKDAKPQSRIRVPVHSREIEFHDVSFAYNKDQPVIKSLSLCVPFGQTIAIVGGNGSGKSTLMNLLARFYEPQSGQILLDGQNIALMNPKRLRRQIAWVTQESVMFRGTLADNIAYGSKRATDKQVLEAARAAHVTDFLPKLAKGMDTQIGDNGSQLSAGQRQRVALARAMLADPRILILDEATSHLDGNTEELIHEALARFIKHRTTFIITHRAASLKLAHRVIVLDNGQIVADDTLSNAKIHSPQFQFLFAKSA
jgi:ATP-binding cassette subfamily B protein/subfamily B ATP-binding cassette protein MsbA